MANRKLSRLKGVPDELISKLGCRGILTCKVREREMFLFDGSVVNFILRISC